MAGSINLRSYLNSGKLSKEGVRKATSKSDFYLTDQNRVYPKNFAIDANLNDNMVALISKDNYVDRPKFKTSTFADYHTRQNYVKPTGLVSLGQQPETAHESATNDSVIGEAIVPEEFYQYAQENLERNEVMKFKQWLFGQIDFDNPVRLDYFRKTMPEYFEEARKNLHFQIYLQAQVYEIKMQGAKDEKSMLILYLAENGYDLTTPVLPREVSDDFNHYYAIVQNRDVGKTAINSESRDSRDGKSGMSQQRLTDLGEQISMWQQSDKNSTGRDPGAGGTLYRTKGPSHPSRNTNPPVQMEVGDAV